MDVRTSDEFRMKYKLYIRDLKFVARFSQRDIAHSIFGNKLAYFRDRFAININRCRLNDNIKKIKLSTVISDEEQLIINNIWSLILVKSNQYYVQDLMSVKLVIYLLFLATSYN